MTIHIARFNLEKKIQRSPERPVTIMEDSEEGYASGEESKYDSINKFKSHVPPKDEEERKMEAANTVQRRSITREKSVRLPTMFAQFGSLDDENVPQRRPRRRITEIDVFDKFSDIASSVGEDYDKYGPSHWIHEYSSDTDQPELKS